METVKIDDFFVSLDPESNFWVIHDSEIPDRIRKFYERNREVLRGRMERYRFEVDFNTVYFNITDRCNANCPYCYIPPEIRRNGRDMDYEMVEGIMAKLAEMGVRNVIFHGAEPLLCKDLIFRAIEDFDFSFGLQTNGFLMSEEDAEFFMDRKVNVGLSFDSPRRDVEDFLRGRGHFDKVCELLEWFKGYSRLNVITTINRYNVGDLAEMVDFLAGRVEVVLMNPVRGTSEGGRKLRPDAEKAAESFINAVERAIALTKSGRRIVIGDFANIMLGIVAPYSRVLQCDISPCGGGRRFFAVAPDGVYPCGEFIGLKEFRGEFSSLDNEVFRKVRKRRVELIEDCRDCVYRNICGSPCPAEVYAEKGSLMEKSPFCEFYRKVIEHAFRVLRRGDVEHVVRLENMSKIYEIS